MSELPSFLVLLRDARLAPLAVSGHPAWLWSVDALHVIWSNAAGAAIFGAGSPAALAGNAIDPRSPAALQIIRLAGTLPNGAAPRLERLRGFGGRLGGPLTCACSRIVLADHRPAILVVSTEAVGPLLPLREHAQRLLAGCEEAAVLFAPDGSLLHATESAKARLGDAADIAALGTVPLVATAMASGHAAGDSHLGLVSIERIGSDSSTALLATFASTPIESTAPAGPQSTAAPSPPAVPHAPIPQPSPLPQSHPTVREASPPLHSQAGAERRPPLRFVWQMDAEERLSIESEEFVRLVGPRTAAALSKPWRDVAAELALDPSGRIARALASRDTWSGITATFPVDGTNIRLAVELSGLPVFDRDRNFRGYRGFGICRDTVRIAALTELRGNSAKISSPHVEPPVFREELPPLSTLPPSANIVPFRSSAPAEPTPALTPVERQAFSELADRLTARLRNHESLEAPESAAPFVDSPPAEARQPRRPDAGDLVRAQVTGADQRPILDRLPIGILVYRLDTLLYANRAFLDWTGYEDLHALEHAGGLDALFVEPGSNDPVTAGGAKTLSIATNRGDQLPMEARLFSSSWEGESALVLMLIGSGAAHGKTSDAGLRAATADVSDLHAILDAVPDGVIVLDHEGCVLSTNRSAAALFGYDGRALIGRPLSTLLAPESHRTALEYLNRLNQAGMSSMPKEGREVIGRRRDGALVALFMTVNQIAGDGDKRCVVFRDITQWKKTETELLSAKRQAENASTAKSEFLAKISHEIRTPLNAIIGFSEVMMQERFGPIGNDRYQQYLKDIHSSGDHLVSLLNDLLDLSKVEAGKLELNFAALDLNDLTQQCVALMQPQASRQRVIIRTSLVHKLPPVMADPRSVRQIMLNLLSNSIKFTEPGGQVIVSTALDDDGAVVLRVRDTGVGMNEQDLAIALEPFRQLATAARWGSGGTGLGLPLSKALAEANRASFRIRSAVDTGTLVEVAFSGQQLAAE